MIATGMKCVVPPLIKIQNQKPSPRDPSKIPTIQKFHIGLWQTKLWKLNAEYLVIETMLRENQN